MTQPLITGSRGRRIYYALLLLFTTLLALGAVLAPMLQRMLEPSIQVGDVAEQEYRAPRSTTFESEVLTEQRREAAARAVAPEYSLPDTNIARHQLERLRASLDYINSVRLDQHATQTQKLNDLSALEDIQLSSETAEAILALSDSRWQVVQQEAISVLEQVMRNTIRSDRLDNARQGVPTLVSLSIPEQQAEIVAELAAAFVVPNSLYSPERTEQVREQARASVEPVSQTYLVGQTVVPRGKVLNEADVEALIALELGKPQQRWEDVVAASGLVLLFMSFMGFYLGQVSTLQEKTRSLAVLAVLFIAFLLTARLSIPGHTLIPYAFPLPAFALIVAALFGQQLALIVALPIAVLASFDLTFALELTLYYTLMSFFGVLVLGRARRLMSYFSAGAAIAVAGIVVILVYRLPQPTTDLVGLASLIGAAAFNGLASASLTLILQFFLAQLLGMTTPMQLMELTRPDNPLLQLILRESPGTYQHSLQVANLAEQAAEAIGADPLLTRVGALYHDVGKVLNPVYFIENQVQGFQNPHEALDPTSSAKIILQHVTDGLELGRRYRLPGQILNFIAEHHGSMMTRYQYINAVSEAGGDENRVNPEEFRYPGPRPQSAETAVIMLADGTEARVRAERPKNAEELRALVKSTIENRIAMGQLDDTELTMHDIQLIQESFVSTLQGVYHPRVKYPQLESKTPSKDPTPTLPSPSRNGGDEPPAIEPPQGEKPRLASEGRDGSEPQGEEETEEESEQDSGAAEE